VEWVGESELEMWKVEILRKHSKTFLIIYKYEDQADTETPARGQIEVIDKDEEEKWISAIAFLNLSQL
jgi:hypothetical protein